MPGYGYHQSSSRGKKRNHLVSLKVIFRMLIAGLAPISAHVLAVEVDEVVSVESSAPVELRAGTKQLHPGISSLPEKQQEGGLPYIDVPPPLFPREAGVGVDPNRIGQNVDLPDDPYRVIDGDSSLWEEGAGGEYTATFSIKSRGAVAIRVGLEVFSLPDEALVFFAAERAISQEIRTVYGSDINSLIKMNRKADPKHPYASVYWSPGVPGETVFLQIMVPDISYINDVDTEVVQISYIYDGAEMFGYLPRSYEPRNFGDSGSCNNNVVCYSELGDEASATAKMVYQASGGAYVCTGTLLNDSDQSDLKPYFLTANHCISSQTSASSLQTIWDWQSPTCQQTQNSSSRTLSDGAQLLRTLGGTLDTTLLLLRGSIPGTRTLMGWTTSRPTIGQPIAAVHHPAGDVKKASFGNATGFQSCEVGSDGMSLCRPAANGAFVRVGWYSGVTEGGSSGSGLFNEQSQVIGNLSSGSASCSNPAGGDNYALFGDAFRAGDFGQWLTVEGGITPPPSPYPTPGTSINKIKYLATLGHINSTYKMAGKIEIKSSAKVLITGRGSLSGVPNTIDDPVLDLVRQSSGQNQWIGGNDDWGTATNASEIAQLTQNYRLAERDSAMLVTLEEGVYTAFVGPYSSTENGRAYVTFTIVE